MTAQAVTASAGSASARIWAASKPGINRSRLADGQAYRPAHRQASARLTEGYPGLSVPGFQWERRVPASVVNAATIPGRWAAPPAPAIITMQASRLGCPWRRHKGDQASDEQRRSAPRMGPVELRRGRIGGPPHRRPVGLTAHDDANACGATIPDVDSFTRLCPATGDPPERLFDPSTATSSSSGVLS